MTVPKFMHIALSIWEKQIIISAYPLGDRYAGRHIFIWTYVLFLMSVCPYIFQPVLVRKYIYIHVFVHVYFCAYTLQMCSARERPGSRDSSSE